MPSLAECRDCCIAFLRYSLPIVAQAANTLPSLPIFRCAKNERRARYRFVEERTPNWWQLPRSLRQTLLNSHDGERLSAALASTPPFCTAIGKSITIQGLGRRTDYSSGKDIATAMLVSYLLSCGVQRWSLKAFERVWRDLLEYFEPSVHSLEYCLYAPLTSMSDVRRVVTLGDGLAIRRLPADRVAALASLNPSLAGVALHHRFTVWPLHFLVKTYQLKKSIVDDTHPPYDPHRALTAVQWASALNEEVVILRSLLSEHISIPRYAVIREAHPRDHGSGFSTELPWRVSDVLMRSQALDRRAVENYAKRRAIFIALQGSRGWDTLARSMRRFAVAWENPFPADRLADIVAALETLVVQGNTEVSYKLRVRVAHFLSTSSEEKELILENLSSAYEYRSKVFHGGYVFDSVADWQWARRLTPSKGKRGNPFHDVNEVNRLVSQITQYYRHIVQTVIDEERLEINWASRGL